MKKIMLAGAIALFPLSAHAQTVTWVGQLRIDTVTDACASAPRPPVVGEYIIADVRPADVGSNGPDSDLQIRGANPQHFRITGAPIVGTNSVSVWHLTSRPDVTRSTYKGATKSVQVVGGAPITSSTDTFVLKGFLQKYAGIEGCRVKFTLPLTRRQWF